MRRTCCATKLQIDHCYVMDRFYGPVHVVQPGQPHRPLIMSAGSGRTASFKSPRNDCSATRQLAGQRGAGCGGAQCRALFQAAGQAESFDPHGRDRKPSRTKNGGGRPGQDPPARAIAARSSSPRIFWMFRLRSSRCPLYRYRWTHRNLLPFLQADPGLPRHLLSQRVEESRFRCIAN